MADFVDTGGVGGKEYSKRPYKSVIPKTDIDIIKISRADIPKNRKALYTKYVTVLVNKVNREIYDRFKNTTGVDFIPIYCYYDVRTKTIRCKIRDDFVNQFFSVELDFAQWLSKNRKFKKRRKLEAYRNPNTEGKQGVDFFRKAPHLKEEKKQYIREMEEQGKTHEFMKVPKNKIHKGQFIMKSVMGYDEKAKKIVKGGKQFEIFEAFNKPISSKALLELMNPDNEDVLWGGKNFQKYIKTRGVPSNLYNNIMKKLMTQMWEDFGQIDTRELSVEGLQEYTSEAGKAQPIRFPNIQRIKDWYLKEGIYNVDRKGDVANHYYTLERFKQLKTNTQRMNFIDRAVFLIANSIYMKTNKISRLTQKGSPRKFAGKKAGIKKAQRYRKFSKQRKKYSTDRTKKYDQWRQDNRRDAANFKRADTRRRRQS